MEKLLKSLLLIPRRIYDAFLRIKHRFQQGDGFIKLKLIGFLVIGFIILIPLAALGLFIFLSLLVLGFLLSLFAPKRKGPPNIYR